VAREFAAGGSALYLDWETGRELLGVTAPHVFLVRLPAGDRDTAAAALRAFCDARQLLLQSNADLARQIDQLLARVTGALWALLALAFLVTGLGVLNTLTVNLVEQARDYGLLHALGLTRRGVRRVVLAQSALLAGAGLLPGIPAGLVLAWCLRCDGPAVFTPDLVVVLSTAAVVLAVTLLATLGAARQATGQSGVQGLTTG
jgi:putative ABC transport system permease protein